MPLDQTQLYPLLSVLAVLWGLLDCFCGYKIFKITILFWGAIVGGVLGLAAVNALAPGSPMIWVGLGVGVLIGAGLAFALYLVMVFLTGLLFGLAVAVLMLPNQPLWVIFASGLGLGLLGGWLALKIQRVVLILATALLGSLRAVLASMYFTHQLDWAYYVTKQPEQLPALLETHTWLLPTVLGLAAIGMLAQFGQGEGQQGKDEGGGKKRK